MPRTTLLFRLLVIAMVARATAASATDRAIGFHPETARRLLAAMGGPDWREREAATLAFERVAAANLSAARSISEAWPCLEARARAYDACERAILRARVMRANPNAPLATIERRLRVVREFERLEIRLGTRSVGPSRHR